MVRDSKALPGLIRRRYREGASIAAVAKELGVSKTTVQRHVPVQERRNAAAAALQRHRSRAKEPVREGAEGSGRAPLPLGDAAATGGGHTRDLGRGGGGPARAGPAPFPA
ncbi:helix-turn-helix domain-containing protein [Streptomyces sp. S1]|uniref:helix-turn-helix domain-containing protein n=1 Tax=Streptomyces sp. S1 TaxID=718288 RepID=UPI003D74D919